MSTCWCHISSLVGCSEVTLPSLIVVDLSIDAYFLPPSTTKKEKDLLDFLDGVLDGSIQVSPDLPERRLKVWTRINLCLCVVSQYQGGNSIHQRIFRIIYEVKSTVLVCSNVVSFLCFLPASPDLLCTCLSVQLVYDQSPAAACLLVSFPFLMISVFFYTCWRVRSAMKDVDGDEATHPSAPLPQRRKILADKKSDWWRPSGSQDDELRSKLPCRLSLCISRGHQQNILCKQKNNTSPPI